MRSAHNGGITHRTTALTFLPAAVVGEPPPIPSPVPEDDALLAARFSSSNLRGGINQSSSSATEAGVPVILTLREALQLASSS